MEELKGIFNQALEKYEAGAVKYGEFKPLEDRRDMLEETEAEILDAMNYLAMFLVKIRAVHAKGQGGNSI